MRGKVVFCVLSWFGSRITPAYAGKSFRRFSLPFIRKDHPRLCGEKLSNAVRSLLALGSPPPMRGKVKTADTLKWLPRITPAYAGKRLSLLFFLFQLRDHPRLCGEKSMR